MGIIQCSVCSVSTLGQHALNCPNAPTAPDPNICMDIHGVCNDRIAALERELEGLRESEQEAWDSRNLHLERGDRFQQENERLLRLLQDKFQRPINPVMLDAIEEALAADQDREGPCSCDIAHARGFCPVHDKAAAEPSDE